MKNILGNDLVESILRVLSGVIGFIFLILGLGFLILPEVFATTLFFAEHRPRCWYQLPQRRFRCLVPGDELFLPAGSILRAPMAAAGSHCFPGVGDIGQIDQLRR